MAERGSDKHSAELDEQMKQEAEGGLKGVKPSHREEFRQSEPFTDETDPAQVQEATERDDLASDSPTSRNSESGDD
ncbi:hypothetical protein OIU93_18425 [Paeniglutamicibacter sp. ZC-3]|uniref:hypothetical protein n=1 Tax=Paeniglutamicibacter sp. ZC-3 TaxID=2986919 RepID=UPI0021F76D74|nr:hypothetical protein [Paeniglutamicibacter sp. ZC-3]MCV9996252.1 hypothetical protein [Paeniglutamicibacter sp. ZC-3]